MSVSLIALSASLGLALGSTTSVAASSTPAAVVSASLQPGPETIIVTASALTDPSDALSQGVEIVDRSEALIASVAGGIGEALTGRPGLRTTFYGPNASRPIIRGLGEDRIKLLSNGLSGIDASTVSPDHAPAIDGMDAQSIEVLKGPAALRFGGNAIGGVVNVVDGRLPTALTGRALSGDVFGALATAEEATAIGGRLGLETGSLVIKVDGFSRSSSDYAIPGFAQTAALRAITGDETRDSVPNSGGNIQVFAGSMSYINAKGHVGISARRTDSEYGIPGEEAFIDLEQTRYEFLGGLKDLGFIANLTLSGTWGDYRHAEIEEESGETGTVFTNEGYEVRAEARHVPLGRFEGLFGVQLGETDFAAIGEEAFVLPVTIKSAGVYGFERYRADTWGVEFGARFETRDYSGLAGERAFDLTSLSASAFADVAQGLRLSLNLSRTERAPTEIELFADGPHAATAAFEIGNSGLDKESALGIEGTARWSHDDIRAEINLWTSRFDGFISFDPTGDIEDDLPVFEVRQDDADLTGFEASLTAPLYQTGSWSVSGDAALDYVRGKYRDNGGNIARMPPALLTLGLEGRTERLRVRGEVQVLGEQDDVAAFEIPTDGATILNASLSWRPVETNNRLELVFSARNLTDQEVREHTSFLKDILPRPGRSLRASLRATF
jgi:iron complex outermembrane recepter protein